MPRDLDTPPPERLFLDGPAGRLDATFERPEGNARGLVLHLHPHPQHGGTRQNNVVRHGALGSLEAGCAALRIDFRGVGRSDGSYDQGVGEIDDAEAAFDWLEEQGGGLPVFVWGFSFGSRVGLQLAARLGRRVAGYLAVAWPTRFYSWPELERWPERMAFLAGDHDEFVDLHRMGPAEEHGGRVQLLPGAGHFFPGQLHEVRAFTARSLEGWLAGDGWAG
jgi:alpha/beta superfamily hydrolase